jgi:hypothetical protein
LEQFVNGGKVKQSNSINLIDASRPFEERLLDELLAVQATMNDGARASRSHRPRRRVMIASGVAASVLLAGALAVVVSGRTFDHGAGPGTLTSPPAHVVLTAAQVQTITSHSSAADTSGTAEVAETSAQNGVTQPGYDLAVTFSGQNIDEKITSVPEPAGSAKSFTTDDRFVGGQFYIYTPGPGDVLEWLHDTNSANDAASMQFPDPRTLYEVISPAAQLMAEGTATVNSEPVTHLVATVPSAINTSALGNLAEGATLTSFAIWVDANDVVQQIALSTTQTSQACQLSPLTNAEMKKLLPEYGTTLPNGKVGVTLPASALKSLENCGPLTTTSNVTVAFANLGSPQSVTTPQGAVNFSGKG